MTGTLGAPDELLAGFQDPVADAARCFRAILEAMARPGSVQPLPACPEAPDGWTSGMAVAALCLMDADTPVWLGSSADTPSARRYLAFQCGAPVCREVEAAAFILAGAEELPDLRHRPAIGTEAYPDRAATLILRTGGFEGTLTAALTGPGIESRADLAPAGVSAVGWEVLQENARLFPLGFDTIFAADDTVAAVPRSTRIALQSA